MVGAYDIRLRLQYSFQESSGGSFNRVKEGVKEEVTDGIATPPPPDL